MRFLIIIFLFILTSCASNSSIYHEPNIPPYESSEKFTLKVNEIIFDNEYLPEIEYPHVEHLLPTQIPLIVTDWFKKHIDTTNSGKLKVKVIIKNASAMEYDSNTLEDYSSNLSKDDIFYKLKLSVRIEVIDADYPNQPLNEINSEIEKTGTIRKKSSHHLHTDLFNKLLDEMARDFNIQMMEAIPNYFKNILTS